MDGIYAVDDFFPVGTVGIVDDFDPVDSNWRNIEILSMVTMGTVVSIITTKTLCKHYEQLKHYEELKHY